MNSSDPERFEHAYRRLWGALHRGDDPGSPSTSASSCITSRQRRHRPDDALAAHLALPKSTASVVVKDLERRGFVRRARDERDERRLAIVLTDEGARA